MSSSLILLLGIGCICMVVAMGSAAYLYMYNTASSTVKTPSGGNTNFKITNGGQYHFKNGDNYLATVLHAEVKSGKGDKCDAVLGPKGDKAPVTFSETNGTYMLKMDCDKDGESNSWLTDAADDVFQPDRGSGNRSWTAQCSGNQCSFQSTKNKKYLHGISLGKKLTVGASKYLWTLET